MKSYYFISSFTIIFLFIGFLFINELEKPKNQFDWTEIRKNIKDTILSIEQQGDVSARFIGYNAHESKQYHRGRWFMDNASSYELKKLINYENGAVKAYSFKALLERNDNNIYSYIVDSYDDETIVYSQSGCVGQEFSLFEFYIMEITPPFHINQSKYKLGFNHSQKEAINNLITNHNSKISSLFRLEKIK